MGNILNGGTYVRLNLAKYLLRLPRMLFPQNYRVQEHKFIGRSLHSEINLSTSYRRRPVNALQNVLRDELERPTRNELPEYVADMELDFADN